MAIKKHFKLIAFYKSLMVLACLSMALNTGCTTSSFKEASFSKHENVYDQAYVINLDRTPERYQTIKEILDKRQLRHKRFSAIDGFNVRLIPLSGGKIISGADLWEGRAKLNPQEKYRILCTEVPEQQKYPLYYHYDKRFFSALISAGELGCLCSHFLIWQDMVKHNYKVALIFEDDIMDISTEFLSSLRNIIKHLPEESFVHLGLVNSNIYKKGDKVILECKLGEDVKLCEVLSSTRGLGTFAYIINAKMAQKLLNTSDFHGPVDVTLLNRAMSQEISMHAAFPSFLHIENNYDQSIIAHM
ncbi:MAG: glycosyltransferase family 25 protein [Proteobacteria bacterium]|nr:glycosyltransferase family 25 protein [Pseudomonadota bacterium]